MANGGLGNIWIRLLQEVDYRIAKALANIGVVGTTIQAENIVGQFSDTLTNVQRDVRVLYVQTADVTVANTTTETTLIGNGVGSEIVAAGDFNVGDVVRITASGKISDTGAPTLNIKLKLGSVEVCSTGAQTLNNTITDTDWEALITFTVRSLGASGTVQGGGMFSHDNGGDFGMVNTTTATVDTTGILPIDLTATWGTADAADTITCQQLFIELLAADLLVADLLVDSDGNALLDSAGSELQESA